MGSFASNSCTSAASPIPGAFAHVARSFTADRPSRLIEASVVEVGGYVSPARSRELIRMFTWLEATWASTKAFSTWGAQVPTMPLPLGPEVSLRHPAKLLEIVCLLTPRHSGLCFSGWQCPNSHDQRSTKNIRITKYSTHLHILIKVYVLHLYGSSFWLSNICDVSILSFMPT
jgi:hypothetical protein